MKKEIEYFDLLKESTGAKAQPKGWFSDLLNECRESAKEEPVDEKGGRSKRLQITFTSDKEKNAVNNLIDDHYKNLSISKFEEESIVDGDEKTIAELRSDLQRLIVQFPGLHVGGSGTNESKITEQDPEEDPKRARRLKPKKKLKRVEPEVAEPEEEEVVEEPEKSRSNLDMVDPDEPPPPPEEVKEPEAPIDMRKEYLGKTEDTHFYFITTEGGEGIIDDFVITDQDGVKKYSAKDQDIEVAEENVAGFLEAAIRDVQIAQIERSIFMKYIYVDKIRKQEEESEEEFLEEPDKGKEKEKPLRPEDEEEEFPRESRKVAEREGVEKEDIKRRTKSFLDRLVKGKELTSLDLLDLKRLLKDVLEESKEPATKKELVQLKKDIGKAKKKRPGRFEVPEEKDTDEKCKKLKEGHLIEMRVTDGEGNEFDVILVDSDTGDTAIEINGTEFRFSSDFASMWTEEEGELSEEGLRELALDALANVTEEEYSELVAKGAAPEESPEGEGSIDVDKEPEVEPEHEIDTIAGDEETTDDVDMSKPDVVDKALRFRPKKKVVSKEVPEPTLPAEPIESQSLDRQNKEIVSQELFGKSFNKLTDEEKAKVEKEYTREISKPVESNESEVNEDSEAIERELDILDKKSIGELRDEVGEEANRLPEKDDLIDAVMHRKFGDKYVKYLKRAVGLESKENNEGNSGMDKNVNEKRTPKECRDEAGRCRSKAKGLQKDIQDLQSNISGLEEEARDWEKEAKELAKKDEGLNPKDSDSEEQKIKKLAEEDEEKPAEEKPEEESEEKPAEEEVVEESAISETDVAKGAKALIQLAKNALKSGNYTEAAEHCAKLAEIEAVIPPEADSEAKKDETPDEKPEEEPEEDVEEKPEDSEAVAEAKKDKDAKAAKAKKDKEAKAKKDKKDKEAKAKKDKKDKEDKAKKESKIPVESSEDISERRGEETLKDLLNLNS